MAADLSEWNELTRRALAGAVAFSAIIPAPGIIACYLPGYLALLHQAARGTRIRYRRLQIVKDGAPPRESTGGRGRFQLTVEVSINPQEVV
ncbi:MAG TPA: hypothetical protein DGT23_26820 [Micromonosporaceae bacterium]|nr:hypothetical protein [Micromonosporaceae bacterium]